VSSEPGPDGGSGDNWQGQSAQPDESGHEVGFPWPEGEQNTVQLELAAHGGIGWYPAGCSTSSSYAHARAVDLFCANLELYLGGHPERMGIVSDFSAHR
jgi:hypothetical protein